MVNDLKKQKVLEKNTPKTQVFSKGYATNHMDNSINSLLSYLLTLKI